MVERSQSASELKEMIQLIKDQIRQISLKGPSHHHPKTSRREKEEGSFKHSKGERRINQTLAGGGGGGGVTKKPSANSLTQVHAYDSIKSQKSARASKEEVEDDSHQILQQLSQNLVIIAGNCCYNKQRLWQLIMSRLLRILSWNKRDAFRLSISSKKTRRTGNQKDTSRIKRKTSFGTTNRRWRNTKSACLSCTRSWRRAEKRTKS